MSRAASIEELRQLSVRPSVLRWRRSRLQRRFQVFHLSSAVRCANLSSDIGTQFSLTPSLLPERRRDFYRTKALGN
ncbi:MAG: hypothetical protein DME65_11255 [Verrucomicrobia bacterium]|nr:MAG: hypothetical protein DME65_11255 [Verrucomicrobiota bacterium]